MEKRTKRRAETGVPDAPQAGFFARLLILVFVLTYLSFAFCLIVDGWIHGHSLVRTLLGLDLNTDLPPLFLGALHSVLGSIMGCGVLDMVSFHKYVSVKRDFQVPHVWGYFFAPWLAAILGLIVFALLQSGLLVFSGSSGSQEQTTDVANLGFLAIGFLSGFGWYDVTIKIRTLVKRMFTDKDADESGLGITQRIAGEFTASARETVRSVTARAGKPKTRRRARIA